MQAQQAAPYGRYTRTANVLVTDCYQSKMLAHDGKMCHTRNHNHPLRRGNSNGCVTHRAPIGAASLPPGPTLPFFFLGGRGRSATRARQASASTHLAHIRLRAAVHGRPYISRFCLPPAFSPRPFGVPPSDVGTATNVGTAYRAPTNVVGIHAVGVNLADFQIVMPLAQQFVFCLFLGERSSPLRVPHPGCQ